MPLWKIYTPTNAYDTQEKQELSEKITAAHRFAPIPDFYVVVLFEEIAADSYYVGGRARNDFVRFKIDHMARSMPDPAVRRWWLEMIDQMIAPHVQEKGFDWEITIDELPTDFWIMNGEVPPPADSVAEKRWVKENRPSAYSIADTAPAEGHALRPGIKLGS